MHNSKDQAETHLQARLPRWMKAFFVKAAAKEQSQLAAFSERRGLSSWLLAVLQKQASITLDTSPEAFKKEWEKRQSTE